MVGWLTVSCLVNSTSNYATDCRRCIIEEESANRGVLSWGDRSPGANKMAYDRAATDPTPVLNYGGVAWKDAIVDQT